MKHTYTNEKLNEIIKRYLPNGVKIVPFLMDVLNLSRESAYRRLRDEISYTMQEAAILASELNISFDDILDINNRERIYFSLHTTKSASPADNYVEMMKSTIKVFDEVTDTQYSKTYYVGNKVPNGIFLNYKKLTKLRYIKWVHQTHNLLINSRYSDIIIPPHVEQVHEEHVDMLKKMSDITVIFDNNVIQAIVSTIKFYYRRNLLTNDEVLEMKEELLQLIDQVECIARTGKNMHGTENFLYLSDLHIESNMILFDLGDQMSVHLLASGREPIVTTNRKICEDQKLWIDSLLKFSVLISRSNEISQSEFIMNQQQLVEEQIDQLLNSSWNHE